jgi:hypothetical protein
VKVNPKFGGQRNVPMFGGQWKEKEKVILFSGQWKEKEKVILLGGQWKEKEKVILFGGQWKEKEKVLFAWWPMEGEGKGSFSPLPTFPPSNFT